MSEHNRNEISRPRLIGGIALFAIGRLVVNSSVRMIYPFLAVFARGMGVGLPAVSLAVSVRSAIGALVPFTNSALDQRPRRTTMLIGIGLFIFGSALVTLWPGYGTFTIVLSLGLLGSNIFVTATQAYIGDTIPYKYRGRVMGIVETGWALSFLLGAPLAGLLIARYGWPSPFMVLGVLALLVGVAVLFVVPGNRPPADSEESAVDQGMRRNLGQVLKSPAALAGLGVSASLSGGIESINMVFGVWMEDSFGLKIAALGGVAIVLGLGDLLGELSSGVLSDWLGKARAVRLGMIIMALSSLLLPVTDNAQWAAIAVMFVFFFGFELAFVSSISLMTEVLPEARATMMGAFMSAFSVGLMIGALIGPLVYQWGILYNGLAAAALAGLGMLALEKVRRGVQRD
jgi:predicted MFS family arabinose efflux permease